MMQRRIPLLPVRPDTPQAGPIRLVVMGLGPIGRLVVDQCTQASTWPLEVVGVIDRDPNLVGRRLGEILDRIEGKASQVRVVAGAEELDVDADVAIVTTSSRLAGLAEQLEPLCRRRLHIVSSAEELFYPWLRDLEQAERLDQMGRIHGVRITGSGINPGFLMDVLPTVLCLATQGPIAKLSCYREVDLNSRRVPLQVKAGVGISVEAFGERASRQGIGHVGLIESAAYLIARLRLPIACLIETLDPITSQERLPWGDVFLDPGSVIGFTHQVWGLTETQDGSNPTWSEAPLHLDLRMILGAQDPCDRIRVESEPMIDLVIRPGVAGDGATAAVLRNLAVITARDQGAGLKTPDQLDLCTQLRRDVTGVWATA